MVQNKDLNSVLVVSSSKKFYQQFMELLPKSEFSPLCSVTTVGEAKRILVDRSFRIVDVYKRQFQHRIHALFLRNILFPGQFSQKTDGKSAT